MLQQVDAAGMITIVDGHGNAIRLKKEPRAMIEDPAGLGYVVKVGTPIGNNDGKVKAIHRNQIVVEEFYEDAYGARKPRDVSMRLLSE